MNRVDDTGILHQNEQSGQEETQREQRRIVNSVGGFRIPVHVAGDVVQLIGHPLKAEGNQRVDDSKGPRQKNLSDVKEFLNGISKMNERYLNDIVLVRVFGA